MIVVRAIFISIILILWSCDEVERNCNNFKTGTFEFTYTIDGEEQTTRFKRTRNFNIDYLESGPDTASVRWINNCEFIQRSLKPKNNSEEQAIHFKIISTTPDTYTFEYKLAIPPTNKAHRVERGTARKIE